MKKTVPISPQDADFICSLADNEYDFKRMSKTDKRRLVKFKTRLIKGEMFKPDVETCLNLMQRAKTRFLDVRRKLFSQNAVILFFKRIYYRNTIKKIDTILLSLDKAIHRMEQRKARFK